ncbi:aminoglycoside phosphotransferase family protein [Bacteroidales bacterium OttesenSCG-928-K03]|nr:aminoglycoside phosphotransferase family protein [Odoribacter sp. OttesenSCG-928-L07]MDL2239123.1 aminoglycoside phosphotransferase family protein [Bacteroidales bacterium OttesenSCG-928-L14]MDL2240036.1 aminoglycoside phosphotransferase family protein [Bacteroidales bacterium OttesenSCG-928-K22]MDL2242252.1 aminoglycoside phosphotransferase family protein [Bacteroidales bacterium OttesenSCG-928-K03]
MTKELLNKIINQFNIEGEIESITPLGEGFINDTFKVVTKHITSPNYILQRKNKNIFTNIPAMMDNIFRVTNHLKRKIEIAGGNPLRETLTIILSKSEKLFYLDEQDDYWTVCLFIENTITYDKADTPELAYMGGKGLGKFQKMLSDFKEPLTDILPGFHNIRYRFNQWEEALKDDLVGRKDAVREEIAFIDMHHDEMLTFWTLIENGDIPLRVTHNDTKISNFLFDENNNILCAIDLDTVLSSTCLNDFGDAIRSYANAGLEDDTNLDNVYLDKEIFDAYKKGYLSEAKDFLSQIEINYLDFSAKYITYEQVLRFLMDYINGDTYYKIKYSDHNLVRTRAQIKLFNTLI